MGQRSDEGMCIFVIKIRKIYYNEDEHNYDEYDDYDLILYKIP